MKPPNLMKSGGGAPTPTPDAITVEATAIPMYLGPRGESNTNEQWLALPRSTVEFAIQSAIDWLDLIDRRSLESDGIAQTPENAL